VDTWNAVSVVLMQGLLNLEELKIKNCGGLLEVFTLEGLLAREGEQLVLLSRLKEMSLHDLLEVRCIWKGPTQLINLNNLEGLEVFGCKKLIHLLTLTLAQSLQNLKILKIERCDELEHLIVEDEEDHILSSESHLQPLYFPKLDVVKVKECNKLKCLFPMVIAHNLLELSSLKVEGASQLVEVFAHEDEGDTLVQKDVTLPKLKDITLKRLPSLLNFCPRNYHVRLPYLHNLEVKNCPNMTRSFVNTLDKTMHLNGEVPTISAVFIFLAQLMLVLIIMLPCWKFGTLS
jgi:hypothetical protein